MKSIRTLLPILLVVALVVAACTGNRPRYERVLQRAHEQNQAYDSITNVDSLRLAADYFDRHGTPNERMRAHYLLGCAYRDMGDAPRALESYHDAADRADTTSRDCDYGLLMRVHAQTANILTLQYLPLQALEEFDYAGHLALIANDSLSYLSLMSNKANCYYELGNADSIIAHGENLFKLYCTLGDSTSAAYAITPYLNIVIEKGNWKEVGKWLPYTSRYLDPARTEANAMFDYYWACFYMHNEEKDSALLYLHRMLEKNSNLNHQIIAYQSLAKLYKQIGNKDSALLYEDLYCAANDSSMKDMATEQLGQMQALYNYSDMQRQASAQTKRAKRAQFLSFMLLFVLFFVSVVASFWLKHNKKMRIIEQKKENSRYNDLLLRHNNTIKDLQLLKSNYSNVSNLVVQKESELKELQSLLAEYNGNGAEVHEMESELYLTETVGRFHKLAAIGEQPTDGEWQLLRKTVNCYMPAFLSQLSLYNPNLNKRETNLCILVKLRFIPTEISVLLSMSKQSVTNMRTRLLMKLFHSEGSARLFDDKIHEIDGHVNT